MGDQQSGINNVINNLTRLKPEMLVHLKSEYQDLPSDFFNAGLVGGGTTLTNSRAAKFRIESCMPSIKESLAEIDKTTLAIFKNLKTARDLEFWTRVAAAASSGGLLILIGTINERVPNFLTALFGLLASVAPVIVQKLRSGTTDTCDLFETQKNLLNCKGKMRKLLFQLEPYGSATTFSADERELIDKLASEYNDLVFEYENLQADTGFMKTTVK